MSMTTTNTDLLIRSEIWAAQLKERLVDDLTARAYVDWLTEFPDGTTFTIPSIGQATVRDYTENTDTTFDALDTGEFQFTIEHYKSSGVYITDKAKQDSFYAAKLMASFVPEMDRALMEQLETDIFALQTKQTATDPNSINGADHRFVATGTSNAIALVDVAKALYGLKKANVPQRNLVGIVDPSCEYTINTLTNIANVSNNPMWEGVVAEGIARDARFLKNIYGFDIYTSNYLDVGTWGDGTDTVTTNGVANLFFSADTSIMPFVGAWRQAPELEPYRNVHKKRDEFTVTARYGLDLYRPENLVVVISDNSIV